MSEEVYTVEEVQKKMKVTRQTVYNWIKSGALESFKVGRSVRITQTALDKFIAASTDNRHNAVETDKSGGE